MHEILEEPLLKHCWIVCEQVQAQVQVLWAIGNTPIFSISNCVCPKCLATIVQNLELGMHFSKLESVVGKTRKVFSGKYFETIPRDLVSAATAAASDLATQYSTISPPLNAFNITGLFLQTSAFSQKMFSLFLFFSLGMSFGVKSVSHDERREILMLILANTGFKNIHTEIGRWYDTSWNSRLCNI